VSKRPSTPRYGGLTGALSVALAFTLPIAGGGFLGRYVDGRFGVHPWGTLGGILLGLAGGTGLAYVAVRRAFDALER
jgi:F0F1-type ATP synthase assembly protein I